MFPSYDDIGISGRDRQAHNVGSPVGWFGRGAPEPTAANAVKSFQFGPGSAAVVRDADARWPDASVEQAWLVGTDSQGARVVTGIAHDLPALTPVVGAEDALLVNGRINNVRVEGIGRQAAHCLTVE